MAMVRPLNRTALMTALPPSKRPRTDDEGRGRRDLQILVVSDTHDIQLPDFLDQLPTRVSHDASGRGDSVPVDVVVHAGDFEVASDDGGRCNRGINRWFGRQTGIGCRLLCAGNHDHTHGITKQPIDRSSPTTADHRPNFKPGAVRGHDPAKHTNPSVYGNARQGFRPCADAMADSARFQRDLGVPEKCLITEAIYLQDNGVEIGGWKLFACPWHGMHPGHVVARQQLNYDSSCFQVTPAEQAELVKRIPCDVDFLITHAPPRGFLDLVTCKHTRTDEASGKKVTTSEKLNCGSLPLLQRLRQLKAEAEAQAQTTGADAAVECYPLSCHVFGHVHATQRSFDTAEEVRSIEVTRSSRSGGEEGNAALDGSVFVNAA